MNSNAPYQQQMMHWYAHQPVPPAGQGPMAQYPNPAMQTPMVMPPPGLPANAPATNTLTAEKFVKGALIGGIAAYLLTNETVQQTAIKTAVKSWSMLQGGIEEMKERFRDAEAELHAAELDD